MKNFIFTFMAFFLFMACEDSSDLNMELGLEAELEETIENNILTTESDWTVPKNTVTGIFNPFPLAIDPTFKKVQEIDFISDETLVAMVSFKNQIKIYPYPYISRYESVNDELNGIKYALTFCPITRSTINWHRNFKNSPMVFRASGYLCKDNMVAHDSNSDTYWSQMLVKCIKGKYAGEAITTLNAIETKWEIVKKYFPNAQVFTNTSMADDTKNKGIKTKTDVEISESVFGIVEENSKGTQTIFAYTEKDFEGSTKIYTKTVNNQRTIIVGNSEFNYITSFINDSNARFTPLDNQYPVVMKDDLGNMWNVFGIAVSGSKKGTQLTSPVNFKAYYWAWQAFYENIDFEK